MVRKWCQMQCQQTSSLHSRMMMASVHYETRSLLNLSPSWFDSTVNFLCPLSLCFFTHSLAAHRVTPSVRLPAVTRRLTIPSQQGCINSLPKTSSGATTLFRRATLKFNLMILREGPGPCKGKEEHNEDLSPLQSIIRLKPKDQGRNLQQSPDRCKGTKGLLPTTSKLSRNPMLYT